MPLIDTFIEAADDTLIEESFLITMMGVSLKSVWRNTISLMESASPAQMPSSKPFLKI